MSFPTAPLQGMPAGIHRSFVLEHTFKVAPARVFTAMSRSDLKRRWMGGDEEGFEVLGFETDFREGGHENWRFRFKDGPEMTNHGVFLDIVPGRRIGLAYTMEVGDLRFSASLSTTELLPVHGADGAVVGTRLIYNEQIVFLDGNDGTESRIEGTRGLLEKLARVASED
jgi:uncharacterized protein YndB with AHSA1/START domain